MSGFEYTFVSEVSQEYLCPICECPMREPVQTKCGHRFCKHCLEQSMKRKRKCPIDRGALDQRSAKDVYPDVAIQRTILDFAVKCPNEYNGCKWTGELRSIETHESTCSYKGVKCTNKGCDAAPLKKDLQNHVTHECPKRKVQCFYCKAASYVWCTRQGHFDICKKFPVDCLQKCGEQIARDKMSDHIEKSCPLTKVECTYAHVGCKVKVQRKSFADHVQRNTECHLKLACERLQELEASSTLTAASIEEMQTELVTAINKNEVLSEAVQENEDLQDSRYKITADTLSSIEADVDTIKTEVEKLKENLSSTDESVSELENDVNELRELTARVDSLQGVWGVISTLDTKLQKLQEAITGLEITNSLRDRKIDRDINCAKRELQEDFKAKLQLVGENAEKMRCEFEITNSLRDRKIDRDINYAKQELQEEFQAKLQLVGENAEKMRCEFEKTNSLRDRKIDRDISYAKRELQEDFKAKLQLVGENAEKIRYEFEKTNCLRDRKIDRDINYAKQELQEESKAKLRLVRENAEMIRYEFQDELRLIRENTQENRRLLDTVENRWEAFKNIIFSIFCIAMLVLFSAFIASFSPKRTK